MTVSEITAKVRAIMNEAGEDDNLHLISDDTIKLNEYIESVLSEAVNLVLLSAPMQYINVFSATAPVSNQDGIGIIILPADFLRLASIKFIEWKRGVNIVYPVGSEFYKIQRNPVTRSGINKPACAFAHNKLNPVIECYPSGTMEYFYYVKSALTTANKGVELFKDTLTPSVCYMCASLVYYIFENSNTGDRMKAIATELIPK